MGGVCFGPVVGIVADEGVAGLMEGVEARVDRAKELERCLVAGRDSSVGTPTNLNEVSG